MILVKAPELGVVEPIVPGTAQLVVAAVALVHVVPLDIRTLPLAPGATACNALVPPPRSTLLAASVVVPVPPLATDKVPDVMIAALCEGISPALSVVPAVTRP